MMDALTDALQTINREVQQQHRDSMQTCIDVLMNYYARLHEAQAQCRSRLETVDNAVSSKQEILRNLVSQLSVANRSSVTREQRVDSEDKEQ